MTDAQKFAACRAVAPDFMIKRVPHERGEIWRASYTLDSRRFELSEVIDPRNPGTHARVLDSCYRQLTKERTT